MDGRRCSSAGQIIYSKIYMFSHDKKGGRNTALFFLYHESHGLVHGFCDIKRKPQTLWFAVYYVSDMIRTRGLLIRSQTLYPAELHSHIHLAQELSYNMEKVLSSTFSKSF